MPAATAVARTITWSGQDWDVRPSGLGGPGPNRWSDSDNVVRVEGSELVLSIAQDASGAWTAGEIEGRRHLGYGTYRWVVDSDLSALDPYDVLGMFTYGGSDPSNNEIDIEPSRWGNPAWASGAATVWQDAANDLRQAQTFSYSARPPYINQFDWEPGRIHFEIVDAAGVRLLDWTARSGVPVPSTEVPITNYWRYQGMAPARPSSVRLASFQWFAPGTAPPLPAAPSSAPAGAPQALVRMHMARKRLGPGAKAAIRWRASGAATVRMALRRMLAGRRGVEVMHLQRSVRAGTGMLQLVTRRLRPGRYRLDLTGSRAGVTFLPASLTFSVGR